MSESTLIVIPARKGSSFRGKNLYPLAGKPLIHHTFKAAHRIANSEVIVTTDDHYVKAEAEAYGYAVDDRPQELANSEATLNQVLYYIAQKHNYALYCLLPPTSPLRTRQHVVRALDLMKETRADSVVGATEERRTIWREEGTFYKPLVEIKQNRQDVVPAYVTNGSLFLVKREIVMKYKSKFGGRVAILPMNSSESVDIHDQEDIELAEYYLGN